MELNMKKRKFTFLIPNSTWNGKRYWHNFPYVEGLLTGVLKNHGYDVDVIDANIDNLNPEQIADQLRDLKPELLGISTLTLEYKASSHQAFAFSLWYLRPNTAFVFQDHPKMLPEQILRQLHH